ncbi:BMP family ABC transporter substrate-binding protein, partial [Eubacteriales bacterium OttesenSCG-928-A19]|nr:BMP family ABC transporter substrate-binding protein [Eubacteriales bacterium OttesenSCG-928-A19]
DVDQSSQSETVITSAMKGLQASVYQMIEAYYNGSFPGGQDVTLGADVDGVGLPMATSRFNAFGQEDYDAIYARIVAGEFDIATNAIENVVDVPVEVVAVTEIK